MGWEYLSKGFWGRNLDLRERKCQGARENCTSWETIWFVLIAIYYKGVQIEEDERDGTCGMPRREEKYMHGFNCKAWSKIPLGIDGREILKWTLKK